jgi:carbohydrate kinase (thermoresistant glucokinase family)
MSPACACQDSGTPLPKKALNPGKKRRMNTAFEFTPGIDDAMKKESTVIVLIGPMGCGKTTIGKMLARELGWTFCDADDAHPKKNIEKMAAGTALTDGDRKPWLEKLRAKILRRLEHEKNAILACSALKQVYRDILGVDQKRVKTVYLKGSFDLLSKRIQGRRHLYMDNTLLQSQLDTLEEPKDGLWVDISAPRERIVRTIVDALELTQ